MVAALAVFATFACGGRAVVGDPPTAGPGTSDGGGETSARADAEPADEFTVGGVWRDDSDYGVRSWAGVDPATEPQTGEPESVEAADAGAPVDTAPGSNRANAGKVGGDASATEGQPPRPTTPPVPAPSPPEAPDPTPPGEAIPRPVGILGQAQAAIVAAEVGGVIGQGTAQALTAKIDAALAGLAADGPATRACGPLAALVNLVNAQDGQAVPATLADELLSAARSASRALACS